MIIKKVTSYRGKCGKQHKNERKLSQMSREKSRVTGFGWSSSGRCKQFMAVKNDRYWWRVWWIGEENWPMGKWDKKIEITQYVHGRDGAGEFEGVPLRAAPAGSPAAGAKAPRGFSTKRETPAIERIWREWGFRGGSVKTSIWGCEGNRACFGFRGGVDWGERMKQKCITLLLGQENEKPLRIFDRRVWRRWKAVTQNKMQTPISLP